MFTILSSLINNRRNETSNIDIEAHNKRLEDKEIPIESDIDFERVIKIKVYIGDYIKVVRKALNNVSSIALVEGTVRELFPTLDRFDVLMKYIDGDGDLINLNDVSDLAVALEDIDGVFRLKVATNGSRKKKIVTPEMLNADGFDGLENGDYDKALESFLELFRRTRSYVAMYNASCAASLKGDVDLASKLLLKSVFLGYTDVDHMKKDSDLDNIRDHELYKCIINKLEKRNEFIRFRNLQCGIYWLIRRGDEESLKSALELLYQQLDLRPEDPDVIYNIACTYSLLDQKSEAIEHLHKAIELGFDNYEHIQNDTDLDNIRNLPTFPGNEEKDDEPEPLEKHTVSVPDLVEADEELIETYEEEQIDTKDEDIPSVQLNRELLSTLLSMGFAEHEAENALIAAENDANLALEILLTN